MLRNRSMPDAAVIPVLAYPNIGEAVDWLCAAFGFTLRIRIADHRAQLNAEGGAIVLGNGVVPSGADSVMIRVGDVHAHAARAEQHGARIVNPPADHAYGERQYTVEDFAGRQWTFSQSIADVDPADWGGEARNL